MDYKWRSNYCKHIDKNFAHIFNVKLLLIFCDDVQKNLWGCVLIYAYWFDQVIAVKLIIQYIMYYLKHE